MRVKRTKTSTKFTYDERVGLEAEIKKAREELEKKTLAAQRNHLRWAYEKAKKEYEAYEQRITDLKNFIYSAEKEMERQKAEEGNGGNA